MNRVLFVLFYLTLCNSSVVQAHSPAPVKDEAAPAPEYVVNAVISEVDNSRNIIGDQFKVGETLTLQLSFGPEMQDWQPLPGLGKYIQQPGAGALHLTLAKGTVLRSALSSSFPRAQVSIDPQGDSIHILADTILSDDPMLLPYTITLIAASNEKVLADDSFSGEIFISEQWQRREVRIDGFFWRVTAEIKKVTAK